MQRFIDSFFRLFHLYIRFLTLEMAASNSEKKF